MSTESRSDKFIDEMTPHVALTYLLNELDAPKAVRGAKSQIHRAVGAIAKRLTSGTGRLIYVGAGTSGRLGVQDGAELWPTFGWPKERFAYLIAGGDRALTLSIEGAEDDTLNAISLSRSMLIGKYDVVIALAASGSTPFTLAALRQAKKSGALTVGIANNADTPLLTESDCPIFLDTGAEPVAGSTRMKAGTTQCVVLKVLSTLVMVRLGYVYEGMMVNVRAVNAKLKKRATEMVQTITGCDRPSAEKALQDAGWEVGVAVLLRKGKALACAQTQFLKIHKRNLRDVYKADTYIENNKAL
jgi:N-acetylmuramic acid 6-phosphate etherase